MVMSLVVGHFIVSGRCRGPSIEPNELNRNEDGGSSEYVSPRRCALPCSGLSMQIIETSFN
jgi:hypothetical protein